MNVCVVGTGYVGLVAGVCFADSGHNVTCVDRDQKKIDMLNQHEIPIYEPGLQEILTRAIQREKIQFTTDIKEAIQKNDVIFVAVGTPEKPDGNADMGPTKEVLKSISQSSQSKKFVVLKSTVPIGTNKMAKEFFKENCKAPIEVINNPEFLKEGAAIDDFLKPDRVVIGCASEEAKSVMEELYEPFVRNGNPIIFMDNTSAEMTKYVANSFLSVKISFINEMAKLADQVGANIDSVRKGFSSDSRISPAFFYPGIGFGGSCFPKDVHALIKTAQKHDTPVQIVSAALDVNRKQRTHLVDLAQKHFEKKGTTLKGKKVVLWGLSFKPQTDDVREAPALYMIEKLHELGAEIYAYDPIAGENAKKNSPVDFNLGKDPYSILEGAHGLFLVTEWNEFKNVDLTKIKKLMKEPTLFDGRNIFHPEKVIKEGFSYYSIGRPIHS